MSFVCTLSENEFHGSSFTRGNDHLVLIPIGYDDGDEWNEDRYYSLLVILGPRAGGDTELSFCILVEDGDGNQIDTIWGGRRSRYLFETEARRLILKNLLFSIQQLLSAVKPSAVFLCTMDLGSNGEGLRKYVLIARTFEMCGYEVGRYDRYEGQCVWLMERKALLAVDTIPNDVSAGTSDGVCDDEPRSAD